MGVAVAAAGCLPPAMARADGPPVDWRIGFPEPGSEMEARIIALHDHIVVIGGLIVLLVAVLLAYIIWRFRAARNPVSSRVARAPALEFGWTVLPIVILGLIAVPSMSVLSYEADVPPADMTIKVTGYQWFWKFDYTDYARDHVVFDSLMKPFEELKPGEPRILTADNPMVVPTGAAIHFQVTSGDVVHSFFMPSLGIQIYAVPGHLNETWVRIDKPGIYYGQCNQICGLNHSYMPLMIDARAPDDFQTWMKETAVLFKEDADTGLLPQPETPQ